MRECPLCKIPIWFIDHVSIHHHVLSEGLYTCLEVFQYTMIPRKSRLNGIGNVPNAVMLKTIDARVWMVEIFKSKTSNLTVEPERGFFRTSNELKEAQNRLINNTKRGKR